MPGVPPETLPKLAIRFYRVEASRQRKDDAPAAAGASSTGGPGLAITTEILRRYSGRLAFASSLGRGLLVTMEVPLAGGDREPTEA